MFYKKIYFYFWTEKGKGYEVIDIRLFADKKFHVSVFVFPPRVYEQSSKKRGSKEPAM